MSVQHKRSTSTCQLIIILIVVAVDILRPFLEYYMILQKFNSYPVKSINIYQWEFISSLLATRQRNIKNFEKLKINPILVDQLLVSL